MIIWLVCQYLPLIYGIVAPDCVSNIFIKNDSEMFGRTIRVNLAKPQKIKEGSTRAVWADDTWLREHAGETVDEENVSKIKDKVR